MAIGARYGMEMRTGSDGDGGLPRWLGPLLGVLIFTFPIVLATTHGGGSVIAALLLLLAIIYGRGWGLLSATEKQVLLWFCAGLVAMLISMVNTQHAHLYEGVKYLDRYIRFALIVPIYLLIRRAGKPLGGELAWGAAVGGVVMAVQAWYQVDLRHDVMAGGSYNKIVLGDMAVYWGAVAIVFGMLMLQGWQRAAVVTLAITTALYTSVVAEARGAWIFIPVFLVTLAAFNIRRLRFDRRMAITAAAVVVVVGGVLLWQHTRLAQGVMSGYDNLKTFMVNPSAPTSWGNRLNLWRNTLLLVREHPLFGIGLGDFHSEMRRMAADGESWSTSVALYGHAHSIYFDPLANGGLVAFAATFIGYLLLPFLIFRRLWRDATSAETRFYALGGVVTVLAFATFGISEALWHRNPFVNTYVISVTIFLSSAIASSVPKDEACPTP